MRALLLLCLLYAAVILYPFEWEPPRWVENGAEEIPGKGWRFETPGIVTGPAPTGDIDMRLRVRPAKGDQTGPARILTISHDPSARNLTLGQHRRDLILRLRSHNTSINASPQHRVNHVLFARKWTDIHLTIKDRVATVFIDGHLKFEKRYDRPPMESWSRGHRLALGNEHGGRRPWVGEIEYAGDVVRPDGYWVMHHVPRLVPFTDPVQRDLLYNLVGFLPFGIAVLFAGWSVRVVVLSAACLSAVLEVAQICLVGRYPSTTDVVLNTLGAFAGALAAAIIFRRLGRARAVTGPSAQG